MTLIQFDPQMEPQPYLARSWDLSEDGTEVRFQLRDDVYWHDGALTTAADVAFTYELVTDPRVGYPNAALWEDYLPGAEGVEVVDSFTVVVRLRRPHDDFLVPWQEVAIMPQHLLGDVPPEELANHPYGTVCPVGNGPFRYSSHDLGDRWVFEANPLFPPGLGGRPFIDRYIYRVIPEHSTLLAELLTGGVDFYLSALPNHADRIQAAAGLDLISFPYRSVLFVAWNSRRPQLADPRVRRAITLATPRERLLEAVRGGRGSLANSGVPRQHFGFDPTLEDSLSYDPDRARDLLTEAGWVDRDGDGIRESQDGTPLTLTLKFNPNSERQEVAEVMGAQLLEVGIRAQPTVLEFGTLVGQITDPASRDFDGVILSWEAGFRIDETDLFHSRALDGPLAFAGLEDPRLDRLMDSLRVAPDREVAGALWSEYQHRIMELQPYTYLYYPDRLDGLNTRVKGVTLDLRGEWAGIREWWIEG
jgi:peptide/nickel transport system substrate-binding protein